MSEQRPDPYGSADNQTAYKAQGRRGARAGKARSTWAVALAALFLVGLGTWILLVPKGGADPEPGGVSRNDSAAPSSPHAKSN